MNREQIVGALTIKNKYLKSILGIILLIVLMAFVVFLRAYLQSRTEFLRGEEALHKEDFIGAITHFDSSIHMYTPWNSYVAKSAQYLWDIGRKSEDKGDMELALIAYRTLRSSFYAVRSFYSPYRDWIEKSEKKIASLLADKELSEAPQNSTANKEAKERAILETLQADKSPKIFWTIILEIGLLGWIGCTIGFIFKSFDREGNFRNRQGLFWGLLVAFFFSLWIIGMTLA